ncbi:MAG: hypothetical protein ABFD52_00705 [Acidobacteriota bacterium]
MVEVNFSNESKMAREDSKAEVLRSIRKNCLDCTTGSVVEAKYCSALDCPLWPYRFGCTPRQVKEQELLDKRNFADGERFGPDKMVNQLEDAAETAPDSQNLDEGYPSE